MKKINLFVFLIILLSMVLNPAFGSVDECVSKMDMILQELYKYNMTVIKDTFKYSELNPYVKESCFTGYQLTMYENVTYAIILVGDNNVTDMDVYIFDSNNKQITVQSPQYIKFKDAVVVYFTPPTTGRYAIIFHLKGVASGNSATVAYGLTYK